VIHVRQQILDTAKVWPSGHRRRAAEGDQ